jgi:hypothetical protein
MLLLLLWRLLLLQAGYRAQQYWVPVGQQHGTKATRCDCCHLLLLLLLLRRRRLLQAGFGAQQYLRTAEAAAWRQSNTLRLHSPAPAAAAAFSCCRQASERNNIRIPLRQQHGAKETH